ncbi:hypothetical protein EVAR_103760_1 [Eumeta japonica]|uniref:Uncharacterized protein n=1 Tax=Eumeta variegata TaxID=151549 RepID=A0A4C2A9J0_EUMVA|nr:hypothetical protein EVAR_103760_1 [Eumeta japonica]
MGIKYNDLSGQRDNLKGMLSEIDDCQVITAPSSSSDSYIPQFNFDYNGNPLSRDEHGGWMPDVPPTPRSAIYILQGEAGVTGLALDVYGPSGGFGRLGIGGHVKFTAQTETSKGELREALEVHRINDF